VEAVGFCKRNAYFHYNFTGSSDRQHSRKRGADHYHPPAKEKVLITFGILYQ